jgi:hypothetical protein
LAATFAIGRDVLQAATFFRPRRSSGRDVLQAATFFRPRRSPLAATFTFGSDVLQDRRPNLHINGVDFDFEW